MLLAPSALPGQTWSSLNRAANEAVKAGDYARLRDLLLQLQPLMPGNFRNQYNLAATETRLQNKSAAMAELRTLAMTGLIFDPRADEDFNTLASHPQWPSLLTLIDANKRAVTRSQTALTIAERDVLPESIAYDRRAKRFLISSVRQAKIFTADGKLFARAEWPVFALAIDAKRRLLWASTGWVPQCEACNNADEGKSALLAFDLATGALRHRVDSPLQGLLGDMTISKAGELFVSLGVGGGAVLRLPPGARALERIDEPGEFPSPQTPALSPDEKTLYVPDYVRGIASINLATRTVSWLEPAPGFVLSGIDGLYLHRDSFVAVQNGTRPARLIEFALDMRRQRVLEANWPGLGEPTHGEFVGDWFYYLANSGWDAYDRNGVRKAGPPVVSTIQRLRLR